MKLDGVDHVWFWITDMDRAVGFYRDGLGLDVNSRHGDEWAELDAGSFAESFVAALEFAPVPGAVETLRRLREHGVTLAVVANWDCALREHLVRLGLDPLFAAVVTSAEAGMPKPDPAPFRLALTRLAIEPTRALHVGDEPADEAGAHAAGMRFAPAPLASAFADWS